MSRESEACCLESFLAVIWVSPTFFSLIFIVVSAFPKTVICSSCSETLLFWLVGWLVQHKQHLPLAQA